MVSKEYRTATLAYIATNHVAFRRITLYNHWERGQKPRVEIEKSDTTSICLSLAPDASVDWEDAVCPSSYVLNCILTKSGLE